MILYYSVLRYVCFVACQYLDSYFLPFFNLLNVH